MTEQSERTLEDATVETITTIGDIPPIQRPESVALAQAETARMAAMLRSLSPADWTAQTDCPAWDVRALAGHVLGMTETFSSLRHFATSMRAGGKAAGDRPFVDGLTEVQVAANAGLTTDTLIGRLEAGGPVQARWRGRRRLMRRIPLKQPMPDGTVETWRLAFLVDIILTRDTWMHRVDVARATDRSLELTASHDGRIVADVVAEWARRHGQPCTLHLSGPAGGTFVTGRSGGRGEEVTIDAVEFCRTLSGRSTGTGLLAQAVPF